MLGEVDRRILDFEAAHPGTGPAKEQDIRDVFGFSAVRYYQRLNALLGDAEAEAYSPVLVHRLMRVRGARRRSRDVRRVPRWL